MHAEIKVRIDRVGPNTQLKREKLIVSIIQNLTTLIFKVTGWSRDRKSQGRKRRIQEEDSSCPGGKNKVVHLRCIDRIEPGREYSNIGEQAPTEDEKKDTVNEVDIYAVETDKVGTQAPTRDTNIFLYTDVVETSLHLLLGRGEKEGLRVRVPE